MNVVPIFFPPELALESEWDEGDMGLLGPQTVLLRSLYYEKVQGPEPIDGKTARDLVHLVLEHAKRVVAHPSRPIVIHHDNFSRHPQGDLALEESLEESPFLDEPESLIVELPEEKRFSCVAMLDTSSSMSGEKHLLASIAAAVLLLEVPTRDSSLVTFASQSSSIKPLHSEERCEEVILKFLKVRPRGFTNIARGLQEGLRQLKRGSQRKRRVGLIATDGRSTEGADPIPIASQYDFLVVLHLHGPGSHAEGSQEMAQAGHGVCLEVEKFEDLPRRLYDAVRLLGRL
jgi:von Willebrand factor type A domain